MGIDKKQGTVKKAVNDTYLRWIVAVGIVGIAFIFLSGFWGNSKTKPKNEPVDSVKTVKSDEYCSKMENRLKKIIEGITGDKNAKVMVTLESGARRVYATEERKSTQTTQDKSGSSGEKKQSNDDLQTKYILVRDADGSQKALSVTEKPPEIKGVVVVCRGGEDPRIQQNVISAVTTALRISSARVCVVSENPVREDSK